MPVKLAVVFYSTYGTNYAMATTAAEAAKAAGAEVRLLRVAETAPEAAVNSQDAWKEQAAKQEEIAVATPADLEWADAYIFSAPTRFGQMASQMRAFIDMLGGVWFQGKLAGKAASAMSSAQNTHGGQEATILGMYTTFCHWGSVIVPPGFTDQSIFKVGGNPYGYSHTQGAEFTDDVKAAIGHQARRVVEVAAKLIA